MAKDLFYPGSILSLHRKAADKLIASGNGDAALLYLCFLTGKDGSALRWDPDRLDKAHQTLLELGLADPEQPAVTPPPEKMEDVTPPTYSTQDVLKALKEDNPFAGLVPEVEKLLGRTLLTEDVKILLYLTRYLGLPPEVVLMLVNFCVTRSKERYGPGRNPTMKQIRTEGHKWYKAGALTLKSADAYILRQVRMNSRGRQLLALLDLPDRPPTQKESEYLDEWIGMGFDDQVIREAYERTAFQVGKLQWSYLNGILRSWHSQGLHTLSEVQAAEQRRRPGSPQAGQTSASAPVDAGAIDRMLEEARLANQTITPKEG